MKWISNAVRDVPELPDRSSPEDAPEMMLVTADELRSIIERYLPMIPNPAFVGEWHARACALGYDGVSDMLYAVERGEPPLHIAEVMARASSSAV